MRDAIADLPSLEAGERAIVKYAKNPKWCKKLDKLKYHNAPYWSERDVKIMKHTATGHSAFENEEKKYRPVRKDGTPKELYATAYRRPKWDGPFPCILRNSTGMGGMVTCHPGRARKMVHIPMLGPIRFWSCYVAMICRMIFLFPHGLLMMISYCERSLEKRLHHD